jgi:hypothetical protein
MRTYAADDFETIRRRMHDLGFCGQETDVPTTVPSVTPQRPADPPESDENAEDQIRLPRRCLGVFLR